MTLGDSRVGIDINPSGSKTIAEIKRRAADLIGAVDAIDLPGEAPGEIARLKALAMTEIESAVMWAVMAAARSEAASRLPGVAARIATTLRSFCEAVGWPRLRRLSDAIARVRESERRATAAPKPAPAPGPALAADPQGEIHLAVTWQREIDDSGGKYPPAESGGGWLCGTSDDPRLAITLAWTEAKFDRSTREKYEILHFAAAIGKVEGKTLFVNGRCISPVTYSNIPCDGPRYLDVRGALKKDHGGDFFTIQKPQVSVAFGRGDEHMPQSPQGDLFSTPPGPLAERNELDEARLKTDFSIASGGAAAADRVGEDTEAEHSAALAWDEDSLMTSCPRRCCLEEALLAAPLHLLRGMPLAIKGRSVDFPTFRRLVSQWAREHGVVFGSWTRRAPRRASELAGGSVYFVVKGETLFRMPFDGLEPVRDGFPDAPARFLDHTAIICAPRVVMVEAYKVRRLCGWRYLDDADAPPDLGPALDAALPPPAMARELRELGLA